MRRRDLIKVITHFERIADWGIEISRSLKEKDEIYLLNKVTQLWLAHRDCQRRGKGQRLSAKTHAEAITVASEGKTLIRACVRVTAGAGKDDGGHPSDRSPSRLFVTHTRIHIQAGCPPNSLHFHRSLQRHILPTHWLASCANRDSPPGPEWNEPFKSG